MKKRVLVITLTVLKLLFSVPHVSTVLGKKAFVYSAPFTWNLLQNNLKISKLIPLSDFKLRI